MNLRPDFRTPSRMILPSLFLLIGTSSVAMAESGEAEMATSGSLDDHMAESEDPDDRVVGSHDMDVAESDDPDDMVVEAREADVVESSTPAAHRGTTTALDDLGTSRADDGFEAIDSGRLSTVDEANLSAEQLLAARRLKHAQSNAEAARTRYGDMMRDDYPRGAARERIVQKRDQTMKALEAARRQFDRAMGN